MNTIYYDCAETPLGSMLVAELDQQAVYCSYGASKEHIEEMKQYFMRYLTDAEFIKSSQETAALHKALQDYFLGKKNSNLSFRLIGTAFQQAVWDVLLKIPYGEVWSYKQVAAHIGNPNASRAVGGAVNRNPVSIFVPCHRVVGSSGQLVGYEGGLDKKAFLLELERNHH